MKSLFSFFALLLAVTTVSALEWKTQHKTIALGPLERAARVTFDFTNRSDKTVTLRSVDTSCDCVVAEASATTFAPGASGQIIANFTLRDRTGTLTRTIIVSTDEGEPVALSATLEMPDVATLTPRVVDWKLGAKAREQVIDVTVAPGIELTIADVHVTSDDFNFRLETAKAGQHYRLYVKPKSTKQVVNAAFRLNGKTAGGEDVILSVYANVR